jgi:hypothetical protein
MFGYLQILPGCPVRQTVTDHSVFSSSFFPLFALIARPFRFLIRALCSGFKNQETSSIQTGNLLSVTIVA